MSSAPLVIRRGQLVQTWFDTGACGATILYGRVVAGGRLEFTVRWESGLTNKVKQGSQLVKLAEDRATAEAAVAWFGQS